ncbi:MAG: DUF5686 and carboxypeptidase regulatory-like domain-containing protein [Chitinophagaceae bacterium]|nr:DUF5686 and carboxypeptidase regulatory-like domain-containing protein [Chitinophagaceae bacterium]
MSALCKSFWYVFLFLSLSIIAHGQKFKLLGQVNDRSLQPLPFTSVIVKGTALGTSANSAGYYSLDLTAGSYTIIFQHVGYKSEERSIQVSKEDVYLNVVLDELQYDLGNVTVKNGEDPAYGIIRNAIKKRKDYEQENKQFTAEVYIKGLLQLRGYPKRVLGKKVDFEDGDTSKQKVIFLSETVARYSVNNPKEKVEVLSTKVSGQSNGFGFSNPQIISFYKNNIDLANLNPRGFISPIADNALNYYRYKFEGTFFDNGQMINRIKVIPKQTFEPLFSGYINIIENEWRIHSLQLSLFKESQMQFVDTLIIEQLFTPLKGTWVIKQQTIFPSIKFFGFDGYGSFVQVYDQYNLNPVFAKGFFDNTVLKIFDSANKKRAVYWDSIRPIPLAAVELKDYKKKDSLEQLRNDPAYLDSLDRVRNKLNITSLLITGQTFTNEKKLSSVSLNSLMSAVSYNTMEGLVIDVAPTYVKRWDKTRRNQLSITPNFRYGFSNHHFNPNINLKYNYGKNYFSSISFTSGRKVFQFDNREPVRVFSNTLSTLYWERNYLKSYEAVTHKLSLTKGLGEGFTTTVLFEYQDRKPLANTTDYKWRDFADREFMPNISLVPHQASLAVISVTWQPGSKYIELPGRKIMIGSPYPVIAGTITRGIPELFKSDVDFTKWKIALNQNINLKLAGSFSYNVSAGGFLSNHASFLPDFNHFIANKFSGAAPYLQSFQLMDYYTYSNTAKAYIEEHVEYQLNGLLTNKIPAFKKLNWFIVTGNNLAYINGGTLYGEVFIGLENILKVGRVDFVQSFTKAGWQTSGIRFSFAGMLR